MIHQAKKKFGQNFIKDKNLLMKIVRESHIEDKHVIEVGPGQGALTGFLAALAKDVTAFEIDITLKPILDEFEKKYTNLKVIYGDFLNYDLNQINKELHVVANVPYYITTPILFKILEAKHIQTASLMIQKEVCDRLLATPNTKAYNALSVVLQYHAKVHKMMDVKRHMFVPIPNVDSAVIRIIKRDQPLLDIEHERILIMLVKEGFKQKRKTIVNNWFEAFGTPKNQLEKFLVDHGYNPQIRAEALSMDDFILLAGVWIND